ncbi:hydroxymethylbilane synthase [Clostridium bowmanii]|uniref:hydroxymethylbilane synthase n=1 Tax=Clostridium bowmanii TaxID=132925 RepID=UPI001C0B2BEC|nr:hydroxymethylbilane synthase [Clostridium bowmanii]MBU3190242.1 hydroxymethylbilane synthase [Clostridium bowmanii]MCA1074783.1 hydroxymethylbilane synthase [Clostridium bowmanii]
MGIIIASRKSKLAQIQTDLVMRMIYEKNELKCEKLLMSTKGDRILDVSLDKIGGKGVFIKEIEVAMLEGRAEAAVHSMKDVPYEMPEGFEIVSMPIREDVRDVYVSMNGTTIENLPRGARIGTSSKRRSTQIMNLRPDAVMVPIRGNVQTRVEKIETENLDGIILAAAGLKRCGMECIITEYLNVDEFVPAIGQGALGIEALKTSKYIHILKSIEHHETRICVDAERSFMRRLNGGCHSPIGAYARLQNDDIYIVGVFELNGKFIKKDILGSVYDYIELGKLLGEKIINS